MAFFTIALCYQLFAVGGIYIIENPQRSWLFRLPEFIAMLKHTGGILVDLHMCAFGLRPPDQPEARYRKPTRLAGNFKGLLALGRRCTCVGEHVRLQGSVQTPAGWKSRAALAAEYTGKFGHALGAALAAETRVRGGSGR